MLRIGLPCLMVLFLASCGDLTRVPPPPISLSALSELATAGDGDGATVSSSVRLIRALPPRALVTLHLPDIGGMTRRFKKTSLYGMFTSPEMARLMGPMAGSFSAFKIAGSNMNPQIMKAIQGEFVLAIEDITFGLDGTPESVRLLAGVTLGDAAGDAEQMLNMVATMAAASEGTRVERGNHGGALFMRIVTSAPKRFILEVALHRDALLVGVGRETVTQGLARLQSNSVDSLANNATYRRGMKRCADPRDALRIHVDIEGALKRFEDMIPEQAQVVLDVLGLDGFKAMTTAVRLEGKDIVLSTFLDSPGGRDFLTDMLAAHAVDRQFFGHVPDDTTSVSLFAVDGNRILKHLRARLPRDLKNQMERGLAKMKAAGLDLERDVFDVFGPRAALVTVPTATRAETSSTSAPMRMLWDHLLGTAMIIDIRDPDAAKKALKKLPPSRRGLRRREYVIEGAPAVSYHVEQSELPSDFAPSYAYVDDFLIVTMCEETLRRMLREPSPRTAKRLRGLFRHVPETVATLSYDDTRHGLGLTMGALMQSVQEHTGGDAPPASSITALTSDFNPSLSYTVADDTGIFLNTRSPTAGFGGMGGLSGLAIVASIAVPQFTIARQSANEASAIATLRNIAVAQEHFRNNTVRDADGDRAGEYGFLCELMAEPRKGERKRRQLSPLIASLSRDDEGNIVSRGYRFRAYLPAEDGSPIGEHEKSRRIRRVDGDLAETILVVIAWPVSRPGSGTRAFLMDGRGLIYQCVEGSYSADNPPPPDVLCSQQGNLASAPRSRKDGGHDGFRWSLLKE